MDSKNLHVLIGKISKQLERVETNLLKRMTHLEKRVDCHNGYLQVVEACHLLRDELGEASGVLIRDTWIDRQNCV